MKLLGGSDDNRVSQVQTRTQDDAAVAYGFQRPPDFSHYDKDGSRWASGDDGLIEVHEKNNNNNNVLPLSLFVRSTITAN